MSKQPPISEEFINAFVDNELSPEEKAQAYAQLGNDSVLNRQVCELRRVRDLVGMAYKDVPTPPKSMINMTRTTRTYCSHGLAAGLALIVGAVGGWFLHPETPAPVNAMVAQAPVEADAPAKVLFHISDSNEAHLKAALDEVENLMKYYQKAHQKARVEVITNGGGLGLLMAGVSPFADRIQHMQREYRNLTFVACQNTIERVQHELGLHAKLLPGVVVIDSGVAQIMRRQHQGWAYIQV